MLNHCRTLLLNKAGATRPSQLTTLGEEFVPPGYGPVHPTRHEAAVRAILMGRDPDPEFENYRLAQYMKILHSTPYVSYVTALDSRWTYDLDDVSLFRRTFGVTIHDQLGTDADVGIIGNLVADEAQGRMAFRWRITLAGIGACNVLFLNTGQQTTYSTAAPFILPGMQHSELRIRISNAESLGSGSWNIEAMLRPRQDLSDILATLEGAGREDAFALFGGRSTAPYSTFYNLWRRGHCLPYRLSGILLALIYRTDATRTGA